MLRATLTPPAKRGGTRYSVELDGEVVVSRSRDPEHDLARALLARGITGKVEVCRPDGSPGMIVDVERMAPWSVVEEDRDGLRLRRWRPPTPAYGSPARETALAGVPLPDELVARLRAEDDDAPEFARGRASMEMAGG